ncbi:hypothetical protein [Burkholderia stagnalis]|uniref:hypothetical protein n=1 Tax=Burkholderia stagnalis TaxID=1503054 RepID=UPI0039BFDB91
MRPSTAHEWLTRRRPVPPKKCVKIEASFKQVGVTRCALRPDDWFEHWPELIGAPGSPAIPEAMSLSSALEDR